MRTGYLNPGADEQMPHTSNMRIRTVPGQGVAPNSVSGTRRHGTAPEGQPDESHPVPIEPLLSGEPEAPSTHNPTSSAKHPGRQVRRSRRWVELRTTTTRKLDTRRAKMASETLHDAAADDTGPRQNRLSTDEPHGARRETVHTPRPEDTPRSPVEAGRDPGRSARSDPFSMLVELATLPSRMTLAATAETLKLLAPTPDDRRPRHDTCTGTSRRRTSG
jgi:hypothetical protein